MAVNVFSVAVFLVVFRETIEAAIVVAVLLAFIKQTLGGSEETAKAYKSATKQVWIGAAVGLLLCLILGGAIIGTFYRVGSNLWDKAEYYYQGVFYLIAAVIITVVGAALLRIGKMQEKWQVRLSKVLREPVNTNGRMNWLKTFSGKYGIFVLCFFTVAREGIEGIVFVTGVTFSAPTSSIPLPVVVGLIAGCLVGYVLYKGGSMAKLQIFLVASTCLLYLVAAGLFARAVWYFEQGHWNALVGKDVAELGTGPGSYDIDRSVWHVNCCSPEFEGGYGWGIFNAVLGWTNSATYSTIITYNVYWIAVMLGFFTMRYHEVKGHWPLMRAKEPVVETEPETTLRDGAGGVVTNESLTMSV